MPDLFGDPIDPIGRQGELPLAGPTGPTGCDPLSGRRIPDTALEVCDVVANRSTTAGATASILSHLAMLAENARTEAQGLAILEARNLLNASSWFACHPAELPEDWREILDGEKPWTLSREYRDAWVKEHSR